ncbi:hypothetical protein FSP39_010107 [Pinctada imbricata]|uniref:Reverse transcriptase domain-containing protein n=2 Tax=Pinctada imbricata TaxID=66713 RepID=A0AA89BYF0_PINIB|nr:hypothetical protein FSP39_010107 [Pinctada imbricata]
MSDIKVRLDGVKKLLGKLGTHKASGPDNIPNMMLKNCAEELAPVLTNIFQQSLDTGTLPKDWRNANISPVFKKGNKHVASNYRPVSLTSVCCKTLEHIICSNILKHLEQLHILSSLQHGFRSGHSCESQLIVTMHDVLQTYDHRIQTDMVILDFSKAFDTVPHRKLLYKLDNYGISGTTHTWISTFLTQREQRVVIEGEASSSCTVDSGVPQGTVLGPLLFLCHINDLPKCVTSQVRLFADDCLLYRPIKCIDDQIKLQQDLESLELWALDLGMRFNASKCYLMSIARSKHPHQFRYTLDNHILEHVHDNPYLGITLSDSLKWSTHINKITNRANSILGFLRRNLKYCSKSLKETAYISLVRSILDYASVVWDPYQRKDVDQLEGIQRRAARFVCNDYSRYSSVSKMMEKLKWRPLADRRRDLRLVLLYKIVHDLVAIPADSLFEYNTRSSRTQHSKSIKVFSCNTEAFKNSFVPATIKEWNKLPSDVINSKTADQFKAAIAAYSD